MPPTLVKISVILLDDCACMLSRFSRVGLFATPWTVALQAPLSMDFSRQEDWSGVPFPPPGLMTVNPNQAIKPETEHLNILSRLGSGFYIRWFA